MPKDSGKQKITIRIPPRPYEREKSAEKPASPATETQKKFGEGCSADTGGTDVGRERKYDADVHVRN